MTLEPFYHTKTYHIFIERATNIILCSFAIAVLFPYRPLWLDFVILVKTVGGGWGEGYEAGLEGKRIKGISET